MYMRVRIRCWLLQVGVPYSTRGSIQYLYYSALGLPRCREVGFIQRLHIISTTVRSDLPDRFISLSWCREVGLFHPMVTYYFHDRVVGSTRQVY